MKLTNNFNGISGGSISLYDNPSVMMAAILRLQPTLYMAKKRNPLVNWLLRLRQNWSTSNSLT